MSHLRAQVTQQITPTGLSVGVVKNGKQNLLSRKYETNERPTSDRNLPGITKYMTQCFLFFFNERQAKMFSLRGN